MVKRINVFVFFQSEKLLTSNLVVTQVPAHVVIHSLEPFFFVSGICKDGVTFLVVKRGGDSVGGGILEY